jgi:anti-anti-sigma factor
VRDAELNDLSAELADLLGTGPRRVVLNFAQVERLSCQAVGMLSEVHRQCVARANGMLKVCALQPPVAEVFAVTGMGRELAVHDDESSAIDSPWPAGFARPLPVTILSALAKMPERENCADVCPAARPQAPRPGLHAANPAPRLGVTAPVDPTVHAENERARHGPHTGIPKTTRSPVRLIVAAGRYRGRAIAVRGEAFLFGRHPTCHFRPESRSVSRRHARLERTPDGVYLSDLGSTNGTFLNGRRIPESRVPVRDGDRLQIGPIRLVVQIARASVHRSRVEDEVADWLRDAAEDSVESPAEGEEHDRSDSDEGADSKRWVRTEVVDDVLVVTPLPSHLDDESTAGPLRAELFALFERRLPRQVVIDLSRVIHVSSLAIGVLLAHNLRLDRAGGALRLCEVQPRVRAIFEEIRLPMLIEVLPTRDEAILSSWSAAEE